MERRLKYIYFNFDGSTQEVTIVTFDKNNDITGSVVLNKTYIFSTIRFLVSVAQRMTRGFSAWVKKRREVNINEGNYPLTTGKISV